MTVPNGAPQSVADLAADLVLRSERLLSEMGQLRERFFAVKGSREHIPGLAVLMTSVRQELNSAQSSLVAWTGRTDHKEEEVLTIETRLRCSNVPAMETHWDIFKRCCRLVSVETQIPKTPSVQSNGKGGFKKVKYPQSQERGKGRQDTDAVYVHAVVDGGAEWLRIVSKDEKRILIEMTESGWDWGADDDEPIDQEVFEDMPLLRAATDLVETSRKNWYNYRHPRIRIMFTRIREGDNKELDRLIREMRGTGGHDISVSVDCADSPWITEKPPLSIDAVLKKLVPDEQDSNYLGDTVLLDTSVLIGLISDASHSAVEKKPWHNEDLRAQIDDEMNGTTFLSMNAYPRLRGRRLVCTKEAMVHFNDISQTIGSPTERERARILMEGGPEDLQKLSIHTVPDDLALPVQVLRDQDTDLHADHLVREGILPPVSIEIEKHLLGVPGNRATHLYGWVSALTVITSNRALAKKLVRMVETSLSGDYDNGPKICTLPYNRALATNGPGPKKARLLAQKKDEQSCQTEADS